MIRGLYNVASAMEVAARNQEVVSNNLANLNTPGYRRQGNYFEVQSNLQSSDPATESAARPQRGASSFNYMDSGPLEQSGNQFDLALSGNAFFTLEGPTGPIYTRNGSFELGPGGELQARGSGYRVRGQGAPLTLPTNAGRVAIAADGTVQANGAVVGRLELASFAQPDSLRRVGPTLFQGDNPQTPAPGAARVEQGFREGANVQAVQEMVSMMLGLRYYEAAEKAVKTMNDAVSLNTKPQQ